MGSPYIEIGGDSDSQNEPSDADTRDVFLAFEHWMFVCIILWDIETLYTLKQIMCIIESSEQILDVNFFNMLVISNFPLDPDFMNGL